MTRLLRLWLGVLAAYPAEDLRRDAQTAAIAVLCLLLLSNALVLGSEHLQ
ncbi:hypothetical protein [Aurantiacibacter luteus]|nr:hypothetical protein [Aurantiacibacter luteus]